MENVYKPIAIFDYKNSKYCIVMINNRICFFKYENNQIMPAYSKEELELFLAVHNSLKIDTKAHKPLRIEKVGDKEFEIFYDKKTGLHYWKRVIGNKRYEPTEEDNILFNFKYNNISQVVYDEELFDWEKYEEEQEEIAKDRKARKIVRTVSTGALAIVFGVAATFNVAQYSTAPIAQDLRIHMAEMGVNVESRVNENETYEHLIDRLAKQPYDYNEIQSAIDENKNLLGAEKVFLSNFKFLFDENHQYMDLKEIRKRLLTLKFKFVERDCVNSSVKGSYNKRKNEITIYGAKNIQSADISKVVHEFLHVLQLNTSDRITMEFTNEILSREVLRRLDEQGAIENSDVFKDELGYHTRYGNGYDPCMSIGYMFANLLTQEQLKTYEFTCRDDYLIDVLVDIDLSGNDVYKYGLDKEALTNKAVQFLDSMECLRISDLDGEYVELTYSPKKAKMITDLCNPYYKIKFGKEADRNISATIVNLDKVNVTKDVCTEYQLWSACNAVRKTIGQELGMSDEESRELMKGTFYTSMYVVPKTYYCDIHPNNKVIVDANEPFELEIDDKFIKNYEAEYDIVESRLKKYEEETLARKNGENNYIAEDYEH